MTRPRTWSVRAQLLARRGGAPRRKHVDLSSEPLTCSSRLPRDRAGSSHSGPVASVAAGGASPLGLCSVHRRDSGGRATSLSRVCMFTLAIPGEAGTSSPLTWA